MGLFDALGGGAEAFPVQDPQAGLSGAMSEIPDFSAPPPQTPEEVSARKAGWATVLDKINSDPALRQSMLVMGLSMMRRGANIGDAGLAGVATYNDALQGQAKMQAAAGAERRANAADTRASNADTRATRLNEMQMQKAQADLDWMSTQRPFELEKLKAEAARIPGEEERRSLELQIKRMELEQLPAQAKLKLEALKAQIAASNRSGQAAMRETDQERAVRALEGLPELRDLPETERRAKATERFYQTSRGVPTQMKQETEEETAMALAQYVMDNPDDPSVKLAMTDAANIAKFARGKQLLKQAALKAGVSTETPVAEKRRVITSDEIRNGLSQAQRTSSGPIVERK